MTATATALPSRYTSTPRPLGSSGGVGIEITFGVTVTGGGATGGVVGVVGVCVVVDGRVVVGVDGVVVVGGVEGVDGGAGVVVVGGVCVGCAETGVAILRERRGCKAAVGWVTARFRAETAVP